MTAAGPDLRRRGDPAPELGPPGGAARRSPPTVPDEEVRNQLREQIFTQRITSFGQGYLQELLRDALIVER